MRKYCWVFTRYKINKMVIIFIELYLKVNSRGNNVKKQNSTTTAPYIVIVNKLEPQAIVYIECQYSGINPLTN